MTGQLTPKSQNILEVGTNKKPAKVVENQ